MDVSVNAISTGSGIRINGAIFIVLEWQHVKPGKGAAFVRVKLRNIQTGQVLDKTFRSSEKVDEVALEETTLKNLYHSGNTYFFMDLTTFEEIGIPKDIIGDDVRFLQDDLEVKGVMYNDQILKIELPTFIIAEVTHADPGLKGDSSKAGTKPATIDTGATVQVPLFITTGEKVRIDTRSGAYVERVSK